MKPSEHAQPLCWHVQWRDMWHGSFRQHCAEADWRGLWRAPGVVLCEHDCAEEAGVAVALIPVAELIEIVIPIPVVIVSATAVEDALAADATAAAVVCLRVERLALLLQAELASLHGSAARGAEALGHARGGHCQLARDAIVLLLKTGQPLGQMGGPGANSMMTVNFRTTSVTGQCSIAICGLVSSARSFAERSTTCARPPETKGRKLEIAYANYETHKLVATATACGRRGTSPHPPHALRVLRPQRHTQNTSHEDHKEKEHELKLVPKLRCVLGMVGTAVRGTWAAGAFTSLGCATPGPHSTVLDVVEAVENFVVHVRRAP